MTYFAWRIASDGLGYLAEDLGGEGAGQRGGRWNRPGFPVVYAASSISLACLETLVHINTGTLPVRRFLVRLEIPDDVWQAAKRLDHADAPANWDATPWDRASVELGTRWLDDRSAPALFMVPSVVVPEEFNVLLNPLHADSERILSKKLRPWIYDFRLKAG